MSRLSENSAKGDLAINFDSLRLSGRSGAGLWQHEDQLISGAKKSMLARSISFIWLLVPLISDKKRAISIEAFARATGCAWYSRSWEQGAMRRLVHTPPHKDDSVQWTLERRITLLTLAINKWHFGNPMVFNHAILDDDMEMLLSRRFSGKSALAQVVDAALQAEVRRAPS